jgi:hypothetical protein
MVTTFPTNPNYRSVYAFALGLTGNKEEALTQAEIAAENAIEDHSLHFNLGQVFWMGGDDVRGRHHLELSIKFAATEEERQDALERIAYLEGN